VQAYAILCGHWPTNTFGMKQSQRTKTWMLSSWSFRNYATIFWKFVRYVGYP